MSKQMNCPVPVSAAAATSPQWLSPISFSARSDVDSLARDDIVILDHSAGPALVVAAATATAPKMAFVIRHTSGFLQVALPTAACDRLMIPEASPMYGGGRGSARGQCVGVDAAVGIDTGISAADRARTARVLGNTGSEPRDLVRPGHLIPVKADLACDGEPLNAIAACASLLVHGATGSSAAVFGELVSPKDPCRMSTSVEAVEFARRFGLRLVRERRLPAVQGRSEPTHEISCTLV